MWTMIPSLQGCVDCLAPAFTQPSFATCCQLLLGWVLCLGKHTLWRVGYSADPRDCPDHSQRHAWDSYYNFFERSAWSPKGLAYQVALLIVSRLQALGSLTVLIDDTLAHKRGRSVWGLGWFRDAVASTKKRVATASGHNWVVLALAVCVPFTSIPILALPVLARLHRPGKDQPSCAQLAQAMLAEFCAWFPDRRVTAIADGAYACREGLDDLPPQVTFVGRMRGDAAVYDPQVPKAKKGKRGPKAKKGPRLPSPKEAAGKADRQRTPTGAWPWQEVAVSVYGVQRTLRALTYEAVWPRVLGPRPIKVVVVRDPAGAMRDCYLFTTDRNASLNWVIVQFSWRWSIAVLFRASKQVLDLEAPRHFCQASVEKVAPWVWSVQSVIAVWHITAGYESAEAAAMRARMGAWDSEWSLRHMIQVLQRSILNAAIDPNSANHAQMREMVQTLKNWALLAA